MNDLILYTTEDERNQIKLRAHLKNVFEDGESDSAATDKDSFTVQIVVVRVATTEECSAVYSSKEDKK